MGKHDPSSKSALVEAAEQLDAELARFERSANDVARAPLDSRRNLERAGEALSSVAASDERLAQRVAALVQAIGAARQRQVEHAELVQKRATEVQARTEVLSSLLETFRALGERARDITAQLRYVVGAAPEEGEKQTETTVEAAMEQVASVAAEAEALEKRARESDFEDVAREADSLRQQLLSGLNKVRLLQKKLS